MINIYHKICGVYIESHNVYTDGDTYNLVSRDLRSNIGAKVNRSKLNRQQQELFELFAYGMDKQFPFKRSSALLNRWFLNA